MRCNFCIGFATLAMCIVALVGVAAQKQPPSDSDGRGASKAPMMFRASDDQQRFRGGYLWLFDRDRTNAQSLCSQDKAVLKQLDSAKVRTPEQAASVAMGDKFRRGGLLATERPIVVSLIRVAVDCPGFTTQNDLVWIVHMQRLDRAVSQEAWINARNGAIRWMLPFEKGGAAGQ